jgi:proline racemase
LKLTRFVQIVDTHTAGEPTRVVTGGFPHIPGETMIDRRHWIDTSGAGLRGFLVDEPRGHHDMFGAVITAPANEEADFGVIFLNNNGTLPMCGHGTIGVVTALVSLGQIEGDRIVLDTPSGLVYCRVERKNAELNAVTFRNVPSFYLHSLDWNGVSVQLSYGGNMFALVDVDSVGLRIDWKDLPELVEIGISIRNWANEQIKIHHPETGVSLTIDLVEFYKTGDPDRNVVIFGDRQVDRSPCGTGTCAKMAFLKASGKLAIGEDYTYQGILGTQLVGRILSETTVGQIPGIITEITGSAHITAIGSLILTDADPFPHGFNIQRNPD